MKVLFLDIDGVLNTSEFLLARESAIEADPKNIQVLHEVVEKSGVKLVLSSSWRMNPEWRQQMKELGIETEFLDRTPINQGLTSRGTEVKEWLKEHPEVEMFACVDDDKDFHADQKLFVTDFMKGGLTKEIGAEIINYFNEN